MGLVACRRLVAPYATSVPHIAVLHSTIHYVSNACFIAPYVTSLPHLGKHHTRRQYRMYSSTIQHFSSIRYMSTGQRIGRA
eukprot:979871-Rhodomonas_salina.1